MSEGAVQVSVAPQMSAPGEVESHGLRELQAQDGTLLEVLPHQCSDGGCVGQCTRVRRL